MSSKQDKLNILFFGVMLSDVINLIISQKASVVMVIEPLQQVGVFGENDGHVIINNNAHSDLVRFKLASY